MVYYERHAFFCTNQRTDGRACCQDHGAEQAREHAKARVKAAGCSGPVLVVYPEGTWYTYAGTADIDEIVDEHLIGGRPVERLKI